MKSAQATASLVLFWLLLTGWPTPAEFAIGLGLSAALGVWTAHILWPADAPVLSPRQVLRLLLYVPRLMTAVVVAALQVAEVVLDPHMPIDPVLVHHRAPFARSISRTAFANSITMTPGTLTVDVEDGGTFCIHCLSERFADDIASGKLEHTIKRTFEEQA